MKILFAASECVPFCKTGGLADVIGSLPKELYKRRHDVRLILPKYKTIRGQEFSIKETGKRIRVPMGGVRVEEADIRMCRTEKSIRVYFVNHEGFFGRPGLYRTPQGDYADNCDRFTFFSRAVLEACKAVQFCPDVIHAHDWQTGLIPAYLRTLYQTDAFFQKTVGIFTIHNIAYQGRFHKDYLNMTGMNWSEFTMDKLEIYDQISLLKAGIAYSDALTTVSPTYAQEIQQSGKFGMGMEGILRARSQDLVGILNGLDLDEWNPAKDPFLAKDFSRESLDRRHDCKAFLQETLGLPVHPGQPLLGMVARLDYQKGLDLLLSIFPELMASGVQLVILGTGDALIQHNLEEMQQRYPNQFRLCTDFNEPLAHHIYGGSDLFLMPSRFEPCGLGQLIAMRYGAIPIVSGTGGLLDTVMPMGPRNRGTGFIFYDESPAAFLEAIQRALAVYANPSDWAKLQQQAMDCDFSWEISSQAYLNLYRQAIGRRQRIRRAARKAT